MRIDEETWHYVGRGYALSSTDRVCDVRNGFVLTPIAAGLLIDSWRSR